MTQPWADPKHDVKADVEFYLAQLRPEAEKFFQQKHAWCFIHGYEPEPVSKYKTCGKCLHCWETRDDFLADIQTLSDVLVDLRGAQPQSVVEGFPFCPLCRHDF